ARGAAAHRIRLGAARYARRRAGGRSAHGVRAVLRPAAEGNLPGHGADAPVPDVAPLPGRNPAATGAVAEDPPEHRRARARPRSRTRPVEHGEAVPGTLDAGP